MGRTARLLRCLLLTAGMIACLATASAERKQPADALLQKGWEAFKSYEYKNAERDFKELLEVSQDLEKRAEALYGLGITNQFKRPVTPSTVRAACDYFQEIVTDYQGSKLHPLALLALARVYELESVDSPHEDLRKARLFYRRCTERYPDHLAGHEAALRLAETYTNTMDREQAAKGIEILKNWLAEHPDNLLRGLMFKVAADAFLFTLEDYRNAQDYYVRYAENGIYNRRKMGDVFWRIAFLAQHKTGDRDVAVKYYKKMVEDLDADTRAQRAIDALKELGVDTTRYEEARRIRR